MWWGHMGEYGWGWRGMGLGMLLFWGVFVVVIAMMVKCTRGSATCGRRNQEKSALDLLKDRYARGEINREEFQQKKNDLER
jgi:putative membrane protein